MLLQLLPALLYTDTGDGLAHRWRFGKHRLFHGVRCTGVGFHMARELVASQFGWNRRCSRLLYPLCGHLSGDPIAMPLPVRSVLRLLLGVEWLRLEPLWMWTTDYNYQLLLHDEACLCAAANKLLFPPFQMAVLSVAS